MRETHRTTQSSPRFVYCHQLMMPHIENFDHWYEGSQVSMATSLLLLQSVKLERAYTSTLNGCCMSACNWAIDMLSETMWILLWGGGGHKGGAPWVVLPFGGFAFTVNGSVFFLPFSFFSYYTGVFSSKHVQFWNKNFTSQGEGDNLRREVTPGGERATENRGRLNQRKRGNCTVTCTSTQPFINSRRLILLSHKIQVLCNIGIGHT